jgi:hypothetical protein
MNKKIYYKVVLKHKDKYYSSYIKYKGKVNYKKNQVVFPNQNCGPLTVFRTREAARKYKRWFNSGFLKGKLTIFTCEIRKTEKRTVWINPKAKENKNHLLVLLGNSVSVDDIILADWVMIKEKIS